MSDFINHSFGTPSFTIKTDKRNKDQFAPEEA